MSKFIDILEAAYPISDERWDWINPEEKLPNKKGTYLAFIYKRKEEFIHWKGIVTAYFDPREGWKNCYDDTNITIIRWCELKSPIKFYYEEDKDRKIVMMI